MSNVLRFDPHARQSSRRAVDAGKRTSAMLRQLEAAQRKAARALSVTDVAKGARLIARADLILRVEVANGAPLTAAAREALIVGANDYHDLGYQSGLDDGRIANARGVGR